MRTGTIETTGMIFLLALASFLAPPAGAEEEGEFFGEVPGETEERDRGSTRPSVGRLLSVDLLGAVSLPLSGDAGAGTDAPAYADAFGPGWGGTLRIGLHVVQAVALRLDLGTVTYPGRSFDAAGTDNLFSDMNTAHALVGLDFYFPFSLPVKKWFAPEEGKPFTGLAGHVALRGGVQYVDHVRWLEPVPAWSFWESSIGGMASLWAGLDFRAKGGVGVSVGLDVVYAGPSPEADRSAARASADGLLALGFSGGLHFHF
jgi:hypothetical protein